MPNASFNVSGQILVLTVSCLLVNQAFVYGQQALVHNKDRPAARTVSEVIGSDTNKRQRKSAPAT